MTSGDALQRFALSLKSALNGPNPDEQVAVFLRSVLAADDTDSEDAEGSAFVWRLAHRLDAVLSLPDDSNDLADIVLDVACLIDGNLDQDSIDLLFDVVVSRKQVVVMVNKARGGKLSRTALVSFIDNRSWPGSVRRVIREWSLEDPDALIRILGERNSRGWEIILERE